MKSFFGGYPTKIIFENVYIQGVVSILPDP